ncbi:hypothetical protein [Nitrincola sp. MINF-07-Sa-05]|uniref:hypothetical protein n=1 Tax=Nitrincola salilacus TaxID=3400273 RepID=UPI003917F9C3
MKCTALTYLLFWFSCVAFAEPLKVYGYDLDYRLQPSGEGHYHAFIQALQARGVAIDLTVVSLVRALRAMEEEPAACNFPATINAVIRSYPQFANIPLLTGDPVDAISLRVLTRPEDPVITDMQQLAGQRVALWNGLDPDAFLGNVDAVVEQTPNESVRVRMLDARRLDVIIGFVPDVLVVADALNLPPPHFAEELALYRDEGASIVCRVTPENEQALSHFNEVLAEMKRSGELRDILGPFADIVETVDP